MKVRLWLQVENNSKFVQGKGKVREEIERHVLSRFAMEKADKKGWEYRLSIPTGLNHLRGDIRRGGALRGLSALLHRSRHEFAGRPGKELVTLDVALSVSSGHQLTSLWPKNEGIVVVPRQESKTLSVAGYFACDNSA